jgi:hypothetical protein
VAYVPQVSVSLFLIYINDIDDVVVSKVLKFADDVNLIGIVANQQTVVEAAKIVKEFM